MKTDNKIIRFLVVEPQFKWRLILSFVFIMVSVATSKVVAHQKKLISQVNVEKTMVLRIKEMESQIQRSIKMPDIKTANADINLQGTTTKEGDQYALINGKILTVGDSIKEYKIVKITKGMAMLENAETSEIRNLYLGK